jgi:hypothetical protein
VHVGLPRGRTPLRAHGGEPEAVDVGKQAAEDPAGEIQRDVRPRRPVVSAID